MYQRSKIPAILIDKEWPKAEITKLASQFSVEEKDIKDVIDFHFKGVSDALWTDKTNVEVTDLIRFQLKPKPIAALLDFHLTKAESLKVTYRYNPERLATSLARNQIKIDYFQTKLTNFKNLGNEF